MALLYATGNKITIATLDSVSTEDAIFVKENLYNKRPSFPFRFTAKIDQTIIIDLGAAELATLLGLFNHTLTSGATIRLKADTDPPNWAAPSYDSGAITWRAEHLFFKLSQIYRWWQICISDAGNSSNPQIGEAILATYSLFTTGYIRSQSEGDEFFVGSQETYMGQDWDVFFARKANLDLGIRKVSVAGDSVTEEIRALLRSLEGSAGRLVIIPDDTYGEVYYMKVKGKSHISERVFGNPNDIRDWSLSFVEMSQGLVLQ